MRPVLLSICLILSCLTLAQKSDTVRITAKFYRYETAIDTMKVKAIGSKDTKASPTILHVTMAEAERIGKLVLASGTLVGSPTILTKIDQQSKISAQDEGDSYSLDIKPMGRSDIISLVFRIGVTQVVGTKRITRTGTSFAKVQEGKALLVIENPRSGQPGILTILTANRVKK